MSSSPSPAAAIATARQLRAAGRAVEAVALLVPLAAAHPGDAELNDQLGRSCFEAGEFAAAAAAFEKVITVRPLQADPLLSFAAALTKAGDQRAALAACRHALELEPRNPRCHLQFAVVGSWSFDPAELAAAERAASTALAQDSSFAGAHDARCIVLRKLGQLDEAIAAGRAALAAAPAQPGFTVNLALALLDAGQPGPAAAVLETAATARPDHPVVQRELGVALVHAARPGAAAAALGRALALDPTDQRAIAHRIVCHELLGEQDAARDLIGAGRFVRERELGVPPGYASLGEFHREFAADIRAHPTLRFEPAGLAARGGSLAQDLLAAPTPAIAAFEARLRACIAEYQDALQAGPSGAESHPFLREIPRDYRLSMWATLLDGGGEIATHIHEQSWLSGAYYVAVPRAIAAKSSGTDGAAPVARTGWFEHGHPGVAIPGHSPAIGWVQPREGLLVMFPSYLYHRTTPFNAAGETRISISFDLTPASAIAHRGGAYR